MRILKILLLLLILFVNGCIPAVKITGRTYPALSSSDTVIVYYTLRPETSEEIGIIELESGTLVSRVKDAVKAARKVGGNGVIVIEEKIREGERQGQPIYDTLIVKDSSGSTVEVIKTVIGYKKRKTYTEVQKFIIIRVKLGAK